jgi:hypothetical protein
MAILKSVIAILQGMGSGFGARGVHPATVGTIATTNTLTLTLPQPANCGWVRVQAKGFTTGGGFVSLTLRGSDGTNFWDIGSSQPAAAGAAGDFVSVMLPFITDVALTSIVATLVMTAAGTGGTPQLDGEVWGALV